VNAATGYRPLSATRYDFNGNCDGARSALCGILRRALARKLYLPILANLYFGYREFYDFPETHVVTLIREVDQDQMINMQINMHVIPNRFL